MKRSEKVTIGLVAAAAAGLMGVAATSDNYDDPDCIDKNTGREVNDRYCRDAYNSGSTGLYSYRYPSTGSRPGQTIDAGDRDSIQRGGFGDPSTYKSGGS